MNWDSIKSILKLSIPLIVSQLGLFFVQLSDTVMVGQIGSRDLAAISFGGNVYFFIYIFGIGIVSVGVYLYLVGAVKFPTGDILLFLSG